MKRFKFDPYSPFIGGTLFVLALLFLAIAPMFLFLCAVIFSCLIKKALVPTGKK